MPKFDCIQNHIIRLIREYRFSGVESKKCHAKTHDMEIGETAYIFNGTPFGLNSVYCSDLECFLDNLDESSVRKFIESIKKKSTKGIKLQESTKERK